MPTTVTITRSTQILTDNDGDGVADFGDVLRTYLHILNAGVQDAQNLSVNDNFTGSTLVAGSVKITPIAFDDNNYTGVTGNTPITYSASQGVLFNDIDPDTGTNAGISVTQVNGSAIGGVISISGGTVDMHADGGFTFTPTTGFSGTATFNYSVVDVQGLANVTTATVNIQVNGGMIWYVDNSYAGGSNDGSYLKPFTQLSSLNGTANNGSASGDADGTGDTIFVYHNGAAYVGGISLEAGQSLLGDGQALLVNGHNIGGTERTGGIDNVATNSVIDHSGVGVTLATDNQVKGLDLNGTAATAIGIADGGASVTTGANTALVSNVRISGQGQIIDIDQGGTLNVTLNSAASTTAQNGAGNGAIDLNAVQGSFTVTGATTINGAQNGGGIDVTSASGTLAVTLQGNVTVNTGATTAINFSNNTVGTSSFTMSAGAKDITTTTVAAVNLTGNSGTTFNSTGGGLNIDATTGTGLNVGGGTINITGANNSIDTTTGQILVASNATVGGSNVALGSLTATGTTTGNAIDINNLDGGSLTVGGVTIANTSSGSDAINIRGGSATAFTFNGNTDINGTGTNGDGVELNGANGTVGFANLTVDGVTGTGNGLSIQGATNSVTVSAGAIANGANTGDAVNITGGSGAVTIDASISKNNAGNVVEVNGHATGVISIGGAISSTGTSAGINLVNNTSGTIGFTHSGTVLNTGGNAAVTMTNNAATGATVNFSGGGLDIDTTSGAGITATSNTAGAGTLNITGSTNSIATQTGTALNLVNTTIGGSGVTFQSISAGTGASGPANGINLNTTGAGTLTVTGTAGNAGSGGTIQHTSGAGILLNNTGSVVLNRMIIQNGGSDGVDGNTVGGFRLDHSTVQNNGNAVGENGVQLFNLTGTASFIGSTFTGNADNNVWIQNTVSTLLNLTVSGSTFSSNSTTFGNDGLLIEANGAANIVASITGSTFANNRGDHFQLSTDAAATSTSHLTFTGNTLTTVDPAHNLIVGGGVTISPSGNADLTFNLSNNNIQGAHSHAININLGTASTAGALLQGTINNNIIGTAGVDGSGSWSSHDLTVTSLGAGTTTVLVNGNTFNQFRNEAGMWFVQNDGPGTLNATVTNNTVDHPSATGIASGFIFNGVRFSTGATAGPPVDSGEMWVNFSGNNIPGNAAYGSTVRFFTRFDTDVHLQGYGGALTDTTAVVNFEQGLNSGVTGPSTLFSASLPNAGHGYLGGTTPTPASPTTPPAPPALPLFAAPPPPPPSAGDSNGGTIADGGTGDPSGHLPATDPTGGPAVIPFDPAPAAPADDGVVSQAELNLIVEAAIQRWAEAGLSPEQLAAMRAVTVTVSDMMGLYVGSSNTGQIHIDSDGAGYGWFVDATPGEDGEYEGSGTQLIADAGGPADHRIDLLTVVLHELGHQIGIGDTYAAADAADLMYGYVNPGERRLPGSGDAEGAVPGSLTQEEFAVGPIMNVTTLPAGKGVDIIFDSTVNTFSNQVISVFHNQATVSGTNFVTSPVSSNVEDLIVDTLTLGDRIFIDANKNNMFDAGEGVMGVALTLYADVDGNGVLNGTEGTTVITTTTSLAGGLYSFAGLAPGDYVVSVDASNFNVGGPLNGTLSITGGADPNDNADNDDNGVAGPGGTIINASIRLDYDQEPNAGPGNDTNNTLDFGFFTPNAAPILTSIDGDIGTFTEGGSVVRLDAAGNAALSDDQANFNGGTLTVHIGTGLQTGEDELLIDPASTITVNGSNHVLVGATDIGSVSGGGAGGGDLVFTFTSAATPALVQTLIRALAYNNSNTVDPDTNTRSIAITLVDGGGNDGGAGADTTAVNVLVNVTPVNDEPAGQDNGNTTNDTTTLVFDAADFNTGFTDPDHNLFAGVVITTLPPGADGKIQLNNVDIGAVQFVTLAQLTGGDLTFVPVLGTGGNSPTFTFQVRDNGGVLNSGVDTDQSANTFTVAITPSDIMPVLDLDANDSSGAAAGDFASAYTEGGAAAAIADADVSITDADVGDNITGATISLSDFQAGDQLNVVGALPGSIVAAGGGTDTITLSGIGTRAEYQQALTQIFYSSTSDDPTNGGAHNDRSIGVIVNDGTLNSAPSTVTVSVTGVNDEPTLTATGQNPTYAENGAAVDLFGTVTASTVEAGQSLTSLTLTVTNVTDGASEILDIDGSSVTLTNGNSVTTATHGLLVGVSLSGTTATVSFSGASLSPADVQTLVDDLTYANSSENPTDADRLVRITQLVDSGSNASPNDNVATLSLDSKVNVDPSDDDANITGAITGDVTEAGGINNGTAGVPTATGNLDSTDVDDPADTWQPAGPGAATTNGYGNYSLSAAGVWVYTLDDNNSIVQALNGAATLTDTFSALTGDGTTQLVTITIHAQDDAPVAHNDAFTTDEATAVNGSLFSNNGSGEDDDVDGGSVIAISAVNGSGANVGMAFALSSGAMLTVKSDGTFTYTPYPALDPTPAPGSGASNTPAHDSFTYTLAGGGTATVSVTVDGLDTKDTLLGTAGADILAGGLDDDRYYVGDAADQVIEANGEGTDIILSSVNYTLPDSVFVETLSTSNWAATTAINLTGNSHDNLLIGNAGANILNGGGGTDVMTGFGGDDRFYIDDIHDRVIEANGGGNDIILSSINYALADSIFVEKLSASLVAATTAINLTGNSHDNSLAGNAGVNILNGGGGADVMVGFGGDDRYYIDNAGDRVIEANGQGNDIILSSINYTLSDSVFVEQLSTSLWAATTAINLTGNSHDNSLAGNAGANILNGGGGADVMVGFGGDDRYYIDNAGDRVIEANGEGNDIILSSINYTLSDSVFVEILSTSLWAATSAINLTGNSHDNLVTGNAGANVLNGGGGNDVLAGLGGADTFAFTTTPGAGNADRIADFVHGTDKIALDDAVFGGLALGALSSNAFFTGPAGHDADDRIIYDSATGALLFDADGAGGANAVLFAVVDPGLSLTASDFQVI